MLSQPQSSTGALSSVGAPLASSVLARYRAVRAATEALCEPLETEDYVVQSMPEASPVKWHVAHTSWFFEQFVLQPHVPDYRPFDEHFGFLFNSYYQAVGPMHERPRRGLLTRPTVRQVYAYRAHVDAHMQDLLERGLHDEPITRLIALGLNHEQQHQELLLTDLKHAFFSNPLHPPYVRLASREPGDAMRLSFQSFDGGVFALGHSGDGFCFDNELPRHRVLVHGFKLAGRAVTNGEFREFIADGGYRNPAHWLSEGWDAVQREGWSHPLYWDDSLSSEFTLAGDRELHPDEPVCHLSYYEADAFARWCGARLPTEAEWEFSAATQKLQGNFVEDRHWHPRPAAPDDGLLTQMFGDVWEWTQSAYAPYPGYKPASGALGEYNGKFMVSQLVLRGGSCATPRSHIRRTYRNFFHPAARWQFSGLRLARDS